MSTNAAYRGTGHEEGQGSPLTLVNTVVSQSPDISVGVIIGFPAEIAQELQQWRASFGDPMAAHVPAHITLVTTTPARRWAPVMEHIHSVAASTAPFRVTLRGTGTFRPVSPVVFVNVEEGFAECGELHRGLQAGPLEHDVIFPYHPHVTVAHDVGEDSLNEAEAALSDYSATFMVDRLGVYEHVDNGFWKLREEVVLSGPGKQG